MKIKEISFEAIDHIIDLAEANTNYLPRVADELVTRNPHLLAYLFQDEFKVFTENERSYLQFIALVIYQIIYEDKSLRQVIDPEEIIKVEEKNWKIAEEVKDYDQVYETYAKDTTQPNILTFIHEAIHAEDNSEILPESRNLLLAVLKTWLDLLSS